MEAVIASVISAAISAVAAIIVCVINSNAQHNKLLTELSAHDDLQAYRLKQLEDKVDKHNQLIDRTYKLETNCQLQDEKMRVANHRIDDLEKINAGGQNVSL